MARGGQTPSDEETLKLSELDADTTSMDQTITSADMNRARIDVPHVPADVTDRKNAEFLVRQHPDKSWRLIIPSRFKHRWESSELWLRSVIVDEHDRVLSIGLPKFRNLGENETESADFARRLALGESMAFTEKMDGSLAIRSVIDGEVTWRTRGTFDGGDDHGPAIRATAEQYPALADPTVGAELSLHFEFVHPEFPIVVRYDKPDLVLLSAVRHQDLQLMPYARLVELAEQLQLNLVPLHQLPTELESLTAAIRDWEGKEGIVVRYDQEQRQVKLKSAQYLAQHRLRFSFGLRTCLQLCHDKNFADQQAFIDHLYAEGMDWEIVEGRLPIWQVYEDGRTQAREHAELARAFVAEHGDLARERTTRGEYVQLIRGQFSDSQMFSGCLALADGGNKAERWFDDLVKKRVESALRDSRIELETEDDSGQE